MHAGDDTSALRFTERKNEQHKVTINWFNAQGEARLYIPGMDNEVCLYIHVDMCFTDIYFYINTQHKGFEGSLVFWKSLNLVIYLCVQFQK